MNDDDIRDARWREMMRRIHRMQEADPIAEDTDTDGGIFQEVYDDEPNR